MKKPRVILFDLGAVLLHWDPAFLFDKTIADPEERAKFLALFHPLNAELDKSSWKDAAPRLAKEYPAYAEHFLTYPDLFPQTLGKVYEGTAEILRRCKEAGYTTYAASNWASDLFETAKARMTFLPYFDDVFVSGRVGLIKPDPAFFETMMKQFDFKAEEALFIDDNENNVLAARALGIETIHFKSEEQLKDDIIAGGVLPSW